MFDIGWAELMVVAVILIVVVGPKDLPRMLRTFGKVTSQMRSMASDFRKQFDEALKEAELDEVRKTASDMRKLDPRQQMRDALNPMRQIGDEIRSSLNSATEAPPPRTQTVNEGAVPEQPVKAAATGTEPASRPDDQTSANKPNEAQATRLAGTTNSDASQNEAESERKKAAVERQA